MTTNAVAFVDKQTVVPTNWFQVINDALIYGGSMNGYTRRGLWASGTAYAVRDYVYDASGVLYWCTSALTSTTAPSADPTHWSPISINSGLVNAQLWGADPTGVADSYAAITTALAATKGVFLPAGTYSLSQPVLVPNGGKLFGVGTGTVIQKLSGSSPTYLLGTALGTLVGSTAVQNSAIEIGNLGIVVDGTSSYGLKIEGCTRSYFHDIGVVGPASVANVWITGTLLQVGPVKSAICNRNLFQNITASSPSNNHPIGFQILQEAGDTTADIGNENVFINCQSNGHTSKAFYNAAGEACVWYACRSLTPNVGTRAFDINDSTNAFYDCITDSSAFPTLAASPNIYGFPQGQWNPPTAWANGATYAPGAVVSSNGYRFVTAAGGVAGANAPGLATNPFAAAVSDGGVTDWVQTLPAESAYNTGYYFGANASGACIFGYAGQGCYQMITGASLSVVQSLTVTGRNNVNVLPNSRVVTQWTLDNGNWQFSTWTPDSAGFTLNLDAGGYNTSGNIRQKIQFQGNEKIRFNYGFTGNTSSIMLGKANTGVSNQGVALNDNVASNFTMDGATIAQFNRLTSDGTLINFMRAGSTNGSISITAGVTAYNTTSDYRLKVTFGDADLQAAANRLNKVHVYDAAFKAYPDERRPMILAHELAELYPFAVIGEKDAMRPVLDSNGATTGETEIDPQGVDLSKLVIDLVLAVQLLTKKVAQLEGQAAAPALQSK